MEDASWAEWAAPSPVRRTELTGMEKARRKAVSQMHQRVRERLPHLQRLADSAAAYRTTMEELLKATSATEVGQEFTHGGTVYRRTLRKSYLKDPSLPRLDYVMAVDAATGAITNLTDKEDDAFWTWAVIETFRHTGVRMEELLEITQLAIVSYRLPSTGETVPLLRIVPSKTDEERLLLVSPELASVLAAVVKRLRDDNGGSVRLLSRYDPHEKTAGPLLPHLFQRKNGWRPSVISPTLVARMLNDALDRAGITDAAGQPLKYTARDFRRMLATDAASPKPVSTAGSAKSKASRSASPPPAASSPSSTGAPPTAPAPPTSACPPSPRPARNDHDHHHPRHGPDRLRRRPLPPRSRRRPAHRRGHLPPP